MSVKDWFVLLGLPLACLALFFGTGVYWGWKRDAIGFIGPVAWLVLFSAGWGLGWAVRATIIYFKNSGC